MKPFVTPDTTATATTTTYHQPTTKSLHFKPSILVFFLRLRRKKIIDGKNCQLFSKQVFFMFQDYEISFFKSPTFECRVTSQSPGIAMRSQKQKLPFACNHRRQTFPVRIAWQGAGAWVSHCDTRVPIETINFLSQRIFRLFFKTGFLHVSGQ